MVIVITIIFTIPFISIEGFPVDVDVIERVEVVRGPSSSLYGTSAVFGVINVITKRGRDQTGGNVKASYGSNDTYKTSFSTGNRFNNGLEAFVTGTLYDNAGYNRLYYKEFDPNSKAFDPSITQSNLLSIMVLPLIVMKSCQEN